MRRLQVIHRPWMVAIGSLLLVGCATPYNEWQPSGYYVTNEMVYGCDSFEGAKGTVMKKTAVLSLSLQRQLLDALNQAASTDEDLTKKLDEHRDNLLCWYETPEKDIELSLGTFCDAPYQVTFRQQGQKWTVVHGLQTIVECAIGRR